HGHSHASSSSNSSAVLSDCPIEAAGRLALSGRFQARDFTRRVSHDRWGPSASEHQPEQRERPVPMLSRRVGDRWVRYAKRTGQRDAQPAEQLWQQLLGVLGERNVPRWLPHHLAEQLADLLGLLELVELAHSFLDALGDRKVLRHNHVTPVPLGRIASGYGNFIDLLVDELPKATYVVLVDLDTC